MTQSNVISSGSEASDDEEWQFSNADNTKTSHRTRSRVHEGGPQRGRAYRNQRSSASKIHTKHFVEHNYHDHLHDPIIPANQDEVDAMVDNYDNNNDDDCKHMRRGGHRGGVAVPFPEKLHYMLSQMDPNDTSHIVAWQPHGRCFVVHKPKEFVEAIMPKFFRQTKMTSFQRQLNLYGFARITAGTDRGAYYHELFIRGRMDLCKLMTRTRVKGNGSKAASSPSTEPDFYAMEPCYEREAKLVDANMRGVQVCRFYDTSSQTAEEEDVTQDDISSHPIIEDYDNGMMIFIEDQDAEIVLKPMNEVISDATSWNSSLSQLAPVTVASTTSSTKSLPALVSPVDHPKPVVTPLRSMITMEDLFAPIITTPTLEYGKYDDVITDRSVQTVSLRAPSPLHSGDQVYFEGLPFHYLETKDIEENILEKSKHNMFEDHLLVVGV